MNIQEAVKTALKEDTSSVGHPPKWKICLYLAL